MKNEALELADELKDVADVLGSNNIEATVIGKGADMIRKLVAEIDTYRLKNSNQIDTYRYEPVAWMYERPNGAKKIAWVREPHDKNVLKEIPLYTAPQTKPLSEKITEALNRKPLSDEEIMKLLNGITHNPAEVETSFDYEIRIARSIEEAHGIK